jgi:hypothetical protein
MLKIMLAALVIGALPVVAHATPCPAALPNCGASHTAPAPLLAAGVPAFLALGGAAAFARLLRRKQKS